MKLSLVAILHTYGCNVQVAHECFPPIGMQHKNLNPLGCKTPASNSDLPGGIAVNLHLYPPKRGKFPEAEVPDHLAGYSPVDTSSCAGRGTMLGKLWSKTVRFQHKLIRDKECTISVLLVSPWIFVLSMSFFTKKNATVSDLFW